MSHKIVTRNPMSEARRQHIHGKLVTLAQQAKEAGEPSWAAGSALVLAIFAIAGMLIIAWRFV